MQYELDDNFLNAIQQLGDLALKHAGAQAVNAYNIVATTIVSQQHQKSSGDSEE